MKRHFLLTVSLAGLLACCNTPETQQQPDGSALPPAKTVKPAVAALPAFSGSADGILQAYLSVKNALVASDTAATNRAASDFLTKLAQTDASSLSGQALGKWEEYRKMMARTAVTLHATARLEDKRVGLEELSKLMYGVIRDFGLQTTLYKQYCPMAFNDKGAFWLSAQPEIRNPYFGDQMLACGQVQEVLSGE